MEWGLVPAVGSAANPYSRESVVRYTQSTEWALDSLFFIAAHGDRQDFSVEEIAKAQQVSPSYLAKIFNS